MVKIVDPDHARSSITRHGFDQNELEQVQFSFAEHLRDVSSEFAREFDIGPIELGKANIGTDTIREKMKQLHHLFQIEPQRLFDYDLFSGYQFITFPYDVSWTLGTAIPWSKDDGKMIVFGSDQFSAAGFAIKLTSDRHVLASVMPRGRFHGSWVNLNGGPPMRSLGGTGAVVYRDDALLLSRQPQIWNVKNPKLFDSGSFDLPFAATATPAAPGSLGTPPLGPLLFEMVPGARYLVWFYIWQIGVGIDGKVFLAASGAEVPLISLRVGDPLILH
jgi:hypothetical protein